MNASAESCPCGIGQTYDQHCGKIHESGAGLGTTAESLMRARYTAYVRHDAAFLFQSWHPDTRPETLSFDDDLEWLGLELVSTLAGGALDSKGTVEFRARFRRGGENLELHELSSFVRIDGTWFYVTGI